MSTPEPVSALPVATKRHLLRVALGALAVLCLVRGISHATVPEAATPATLLLLQYPPVWVWAVLWLAGGLASAVAILWLRIATTVISVGVGMHMAWAVVFLVGWWLDTSVLGHVTAMQYVLTAVLLAVVAALTAPATRGQVSAR